MSFLSQSQDFINSISGILSTYTSYEEAIFGVDVDEESKYQRVLEFEKTIKTDIWGIFYVKYFLQ